MKNDLQAALELLDELEKSTRRVEWIGGIYDSFVDAYCQPNSPVSSSEIPERDRLEQKIWDWYDKARDKRYDLEDRANELQKKFRRNKKFLARFKAVFKQIASYELGIPIEDMPA